MPTAKAIEAYPLDLRLVVEKVLGEGCEVPVNLDSMNEVNRLRTQVYGLRKALTIHANPLQEIAPSLATRIDKSDGGFSLIICTIENLVPQGLRDAAKGL